MLKGDLVTAPLPEVLRSLAASAATGCLRVRLGGDEGGEAKAFLRSGKVYAVALPHRRPQLGPRLVSSGDLDPSALAEAYDAQRTELQGWRLGELLVHLGLVEQEVVEAAVGEQLREAAFELLLWTRGVWRFRRDEKTREDVAPPVPVEDLLADAAAFTSSWEPLRAHVHAPDAVPVLSAAGTSPDTLSLDGDAWSLLCTVDGTSTLSQLAGSSGLSLLEAAQVVVALMDAGLVEIEAPFVEPVVEPVVKVVAEPVAELPDEPDDLPGPAAVASRLAEALRGLGPVPVLAPMAPTAMDGEDLTRSLQHDHDDQAVVGSLTRASASLSVVLGHTEEQDDPLDLPSSGLAPVPLAPLDDLEAARRGRDAQELAEQQAALEAEHAAALRAARAEMTDLLHRPAAAPPVEDERPRPAAPPEADEEPPAEPAAMDRRDDDRPAPHGADTAALLRELSSLGLEDEPELLPQQRSAPSPAVVRPLTTVAQKKRKGLFGRS